MFVTINYGNKQKALFNPHCQTKLLLENISARCRYPREKELELADEFGNLKNIQQLGCRYASEVLRTERENLVLIDVTRPPQQPSLDDSNPNLLNVSPTLEKENVIYTPLLYDEDVVNQKFIARLTNKGSPRPESRRKRDRKDKVRRSNESSTNLSDKEKELDTNMLSQSMTSVTSGKGLNGKTKRKTTTPNKNRKDKK